MIFVSGDRHRTELLARAAGTVPIIELTCSPLTSTSRPAPESERVNPSRVEGTLVEKRNFCVLRFSGRGDARTLEIVTIDAYGNELWRREAGALTESVRAAQKSSARDSFAR